MKAIPDTRLQRLLGGDDLTALRKRLRKHYERAPPHTPAKVIRIANLKPVEHRALAAILGRSQRYSSSMQVDISLIDASLQRSGIATSLRDALELLDGPVVHLATIRQRQQILWSEVVASCNDARLIRLIEKPAGLGLLKRLARQQPPVAADLCRRVEEVLQHLPAKGIARSQLAAQTLGDAHALDNGQPIATLILAAWRRAHQSDPSEAEDVPDDAVVEPGDRIRDVWAGAGVLVNELARPALFLNIPMREAPDCSPLPGEPAYASLRRLLRSPSRWDVAGRNVYVCENPNLLAIAADHWGPRCAPMVCIDGMPGAAQRCIMSQLTKAGARLLYHGDFDWPGLRIGNHIMREHDARPWRYGAADYAAAIGAASSAGHPLSGTAVDALWDAELATVMRQHGISVAEEALAASLLPDLAVDNMHRDIEVSS